MLSLCKGVALYRPSPISARQTATVRIGRYHRRRLFGSSGRPKARRRRRIWCRGRRARSLRRRDQASFAHPAQLLHVESFLDKIRFLSAAAAHHRLTAGFLEPLIKPNEAADGVALAGTRQTIVKLLACLLCARLELVVAIPHLAALIGKTLAGIGHAVVGIAIAVAVDVKAIGNPVAVEIDGHTDADTQGTGLNQVSGEPHRDQIRKGRHDLRDIRRLGEITLQLRIDHVVKELLEPVLRQGEQLAVNELGLDPIERAARKGGAVGVRAAEEIVKMGDVF